MSNAKPAPRRPHFYAGRDRKGYYILRVSYDQPYEPAGEHDYCGVDAVRDGTKRLLAAAGIRPRKGRWIEIKLTAKRARK